MRTVQPEPGETRRQFEEEVFPTEFRYIHDRRKSADDKRPLNRPEPTTDNGLVGVALSGGGIRSASFSLGFLQALGARFRHIDYLSTVSGGGFIGSAVSALMASDRYRDRKVRFPFARTCGALEPEPLCHLRNNSNYLAPDGPGDILRLLAVLLRGIILNSLSLFPFLLLVCLVVLVLYGQPLADRARFDDQEAQIDGLLDRYIGDMLDREREIDPLLQVLEQEALLRIDEGKERGDVIHQLRPAFSFGRGTTGDLITGTGRRASPFRLAPGADRRQLARALLEGDVLQRYEVIEEVALLARVLEQGGYRHERVPAKATSSQPGSSVSTSLPLLTDVTLPVEIPAVFDIDSLVDGLQKHQLIRAGTSPASLQGFLERYRRQRLKPVLQALYNGEFLDERTLDALVRKELERSPYYAYGWYAARVGEAFKGGWHASHAPSRSSVQAELDGLVGPFAEECGAAIQAALQAELPDEPAASCGETLATPACFRPGTTPCDLNRLLDFVEVEGDRTPAVVNALYYGEYLDETWVRATLEKHFSGSESRRLAEQLIEDGYRKCPLSDHPSCCTQPKSLPSLECGIDSLPEGAEEPVWPWPTGRQELIDRLVLARETVPVDLRDLLRATGLDATVAGWEPFTDPDPEGLGKVLDPLMPKLDGGWVRNRLYIYSYGWHRRLVGNAHPSDWCDGTLAGRGTADCPEASDEDWSELGRALRDPSRWNPNRLALPFTGMTLRLALGWVLLFPLLVLGARFVYRRRQHAIGARPNPLPALLSRTGLFDQSLNWRSLYEQSFGWLLAAILGIGLIELLPYAVHHFHYLVLRDQPARTLLLGVGSLLVTALAGPALALLRRFWRVVALTLLMLAGPLLLLIVFVYTMELVVYAPPTGSETVSGFLHSLLWFEEGGRLLLSWRSALGLFAVTAIVSLALAWLIDINATSLHALYRDRLAKAFMVGLDTEGDAEPEEDLALHQICPPGSGAPYHLLNVALNLQGSGDRSLRGRNADFLFFSRGWVGGPRTGYCRASDLAWVFPHVHLASAMAASAAAVSPNMGRYKSGPLAILMSLLNTRLALWMPHPGAVRKWFHGSGPDPVDDSAPGGGTEPAILAGGLLGLWRRFRLRAPATLLWKELFGTIRDTGPMVNVSDGGHLENTGALELLRRHCREIVIVDGEADPDMAFGGLAQLQRIARLDMGIEIDIDLAELARDENGLSRSRSAIGVIRYPTDEEAAGPDEVNERATETGWLLYVKLAVTGDEDGTVAEYRARNERFPHESTGDQAFDEGQFEAYRALGCLAGEEIFGAAGDGDSEWPRPGGGPDIEAGSEVSR